MITLLAGLASPAFACPTVATGTSNPLSFDVAQVAIVRQGSRTTFSVSINPAGPSQPFALLLPVPEILAEDEIRTLDGEIFNHLDGFTAPRHVTDAGCPTDDSYPSDAEGGDTGESGAPEGSVDVEAEYLVGEYLITILSADESTALGAWLDTNGYFLPAGAEPMLAEYIEAGSYFLAAKVADSAATADGSALSPLQISYDNDVFSVPIRLATLNSPGEQDLVIYAVTDYSDGRVGISNYPEFEVPDRCIWGDPATDDFGVFYADLYDASRDATGDAAWTVEFVGRPYECNPCTSVNVELEHLTELGFTGTDEPYITRIHMQYTPEEADQDITLYHSGIQTAEVTSYADDFSQNYSCVETFCDGTATPGSDADADTDADTDADADADTDVDEETDDGGPKADGAICGTTGLPGIAGLGVAFAALARRRKKEV